MKKKKTIIILFIILAILIAGVFLTLHFLKDENKITVSERKWLDENTKTVSNINIENDLNIFADNGEGVYYDFLNDFSKEYSLTLNPITYTGSASKSGINFTYKNSVSENDIVMYTDHFVLVGKNDEIINSNSDLSGKKIGVLSSDLPYISPYLDNNNITFTQYNTKSELLLDMKDTLNYMLVPLDSYLDTILNKNYFIINHYSDIKCYYTISMDDSVLSSVMKKYYNSWTGLKQNYNNNELNLFIKNLNISDTEIDAIRSVNYRYGFVNASPYEVIKGGTYGGIIAVALKEFSDFSKVDFNFIKYKNNDDFIKSIKNNDIDLYFNHYNFTTDWNETSNTFNVSYDIIANKNNNISINSINSLKGQTIYVQDNSLLKNYINNISNINVKTYSTEKELAKLNNKDVLIIIDSNVFNYYQENILDNYSERYTNYSNQAYNFKVDNNGALYKLLNKYMSTLDKKTLVNEGLLNHYDTMRSGIIISTIAKYLIYLVTLAVLILLFAVKRSRKIKIAKKIKKEDKLKFIDQLTSLKNRNYLNECLETWNNNTIYPQTIIVVDLNAVQAINDQYGYNEGDKQIQACANALIKTQLDNSEVMRTDGNEFVIYLVGYTQKQIINYLHKLSKEMEKLPYENGAKFGYSMIENDIKTIEDALNEAVEDMKAQKKENIDESKNQ
jgi:diguanylate cyclase (GGDEF)-like protein